MNPRKVFFIVASTMIAALALPAWLSAQQQQEDAERKREHLRYKLIEIGTLGGPSSLSYFGDAQSLNDRGAVVGLADTAASDPNFPNLNPYLFFDPFIHHAFRWKDGTLTDLGAFPGTNNSEVGWINDRGLAAGSSVKKNSTPIVAAC